MLNLNKSEKVLWNAKNLHFGISWLFIEDFKNLPLCKVLLIILKLSFKLIYTKICDLRIFTKFWPKEVRKLLPST